jgi:glycosyltransferase involved in cell wall biosynthesis
MGTLEPRKNIPGLLSAYLALRSRHPDAPKLVLAGKAPAEAAALLATLSKPPLAGHVEHLGYVRPEERQSLYQDAALLILPSFDEGFGLPIVEALSLGVPVVAANRGALPEVVGDAGLLIEPDDPEGMAAAMQVLLTDAALAAGLVSRGRDRARLFSWERCAAETRAAYALAVEARRGRQAQRRSADAIDR